MKSRTNANFSDPELTHPPLVSVISVNYNGTELTCKLIESLQHISYPNIEIIIVDNASKESIAPIQEKYPQVTLIKSKENLGFAGGNNLGFQAANGNYFLMLNNDTEVDPNFLEPLVEQMQSSPSIGCVSSKLIYYFKENTIQYAGNDGMNTITGRAFSRGWGELDAGQYNDVRSIQLAHGAAMMLKKEMVQDIGLMADVYFLYYEEVDYCKRMIDSGYSIYYVGASKVYHKESMSVGKDSPLKAYYMGRNRALYIRRNSKGLEKMMSFLYFHIIAVPKSTLTYLFKGEIKQALAYIKGVSWNFTHFNIYTNPVLTNSK